MIERINKDMIIADMLKIDAGIAAILMASGMHCIGCLLHREKAFQKLPWYMVLMQMNLWLQ